MSSWEIYSSKSTHDLYGEQQSFQFSFPVSQVDSAEVAGTQVNAADVINSQVNDSRINALSLENLKAENSSSAFNEKNIKRHDNLETLVPFDGWPSGELSEIKCDKGEDVFHMLLPLLSKMNAESRWITLISPPADIDKKLFAYYGIDVSRVLLIHPRHDVSDTVTMNTALKNGNSGIVIIWTDKLPSRLVAQWRKSVKQGQCTGVIVNADSAISRSRSIAMSLVIESTDKLISIVSAKSFGKINKSFLVRRYPKVDLKMDKNDWSLGIARLDFVAGE